MVCGPAQIEIHFEKSGIKVRPIELDNFENQDGFDYARIRVTREAGELINDSHIPKEPVKIVSGDTTIARHYIPDDDNGISLTEDDGYIRLYDEMRFFDSVSVNKDFAGAWEIEDIFHELFSDAYMADEHGILKDWWEPAEVDFSVDSESRWQDIQNKYGFAGADENIALTVGGGSEIPVLSRAMDWGLEKWINNEWSIWSESTGYDFEDMTVFEAFYQLTEDYGFSMFFDDEGIFRIGSKNFEPELYVGGMEGTALNLISLSIPYSADTVKAIVVRGAAKHESEQKDWELEKNDDTIRAEATSVRSDVQNGDILYHEARNVEKGDDLEEIAERKLLEAIIQSNSGNITIDALSSEQSDFNIKEINIGDYFIVTDYNKCGRDIRGGFYIVNSVHHKLSNWEGWTVNIDIHEVPRGNVETKSYFFDPTNEEFLDDAEHQYDFSFNIREEWDRAFG